MDLTNLITVTYLVLSGLISLISLKLFNVKESTRPSSNARKALFTSNLKRT